MCAGSRSSSNSQIHDKTAAVDKLLAFRRQQAKGSTNLSAPSLFYPKSWIKLIKFKRAKACHNTKIRIGTNRRCRLSKHVHTYVCLCNGMFGNSRVFKPLKSYEFKNKFCKCSHSKDWHKNKLWKEFRWLEITWFLEIVAYKTFVK